MRVAKGLGVRVVPWKCDEQLFGSYVQHLVMRVLDELRHELSDLAFESVLNTVDEHLYDL